MQITRSTRTSIFIHRGFVFRRCFQISGLPSHASATTSSIKRFSQSHQMARESRPPDQGVRPRRCFQSTQYTPQWRPVSHCIFRPRLVLLIFHVDEVARPHLEIYHSWAQALVPQDPLQPKKARKSHKELHDEVAPHLPTTITDAPENPPARSKISGRRRGLTIFIGRQDPMEGPVLPSASKVPPLPRRVLSLDQFNGHNYSPSRPRVSPVFDRFPSIETRLSQSEDEAVEPSDTAPAALKRSQSLAARPTTPKRRQSALIAERIRALNAAVESPEPVIDRPIRRSTRPLPISPSRA